MGWKERLPEQRSPQKWCLWTSLSLCAGGVRWTAGQIEGEGRKDEEDDNKMREGERRRKRNETQSAVKFLSSHVVDLH